MVYGSPTERAAAGSLFMIRALRTHLMRSKPTVWQEPAGWGNDQKARSTVGSKLSIRMLNSNAEFERWIRTLNPNARWKR